MEIRQRLVVDTNALVSRLLLPESVAGRAVRRAIEGGQLLVSEDTMNELATVLARRKFDSYVSIDDRKAFLRHFGQIAEMVTIYGHIAVCRDPDDDKFLELAVNGRAALIITGDADLLALNPFRGIPIMSPASYLKR